MAVAVVVRERDRQASRHASQGLGSRRRLRSLRRTFDREGHVRMGTALHTSYASYVHFYA